VQQHIGIGVSREAFFIRYFNPADDKLAVLN
jgi:hypothetical protein